MVKSAAHPKPAKSSRVRLSDLRGLSRLARDATVGVTDLVEAMHHTIVRTPGILGRPPDGRTGGITGLVYRSVRGVTRLVGGSVDALLERFGTLTDDKPSALERDALLAALNGVLGDYLETSGNPLATAMCLRSAGVPLALSAPALAEAFPHAGSRVLVLVHGLCMSDRQWTRRGHDHGAALARDLGYTPVYLHYNSGRHVSANGRDFADVLEALVQAWPRPIEQLAMIGHSMGGLVARSACHYAGLAGHAWVERLGPVVFLGTPHFGAPLERSGTWADFLIGISPYSAPFARIGKVRSAGIRDLGHGYLRDEDWQSRAATSARTGPALPLPPGVRGYAIAASRQRQAGRADAKARGDGLVPVASALGTCPGSPRDLGLPEARRWIAFGTGHFDLLDRLEVYGQIRDWLARDEAGV